ncbi:helix-turn-helix transcriptional regulator [Chryseobacterium sp. UNC8MFCol]|uniref:helix-turn-helix transcriptional regulator n=1 Tax=Chryseobacterium sp. UNC8MFCol TaxID=1340435 RepID=UPI000482CF33|nr:AraC family transcriptional regulator [Chryseobacterium sp. UNC8MFCol]
MTLRLYDAKTEQTLIEKEYPDAFFQNDGQIRESVIHIKPPIGNGFYHEICFENVHIGFGNVSLARRLMLYVESDFDSVEMHFTISGKSEAQSENFQKIICFENDQHNIIYAHQMCGKMEFDGHDMQILEINLAPGFFKKFLPENSGLFEAFRTAIEDRNSCLIAPEHRRISIEMYQILTDIMHCNRKGTFKRIYLEAKITELLLLQLEQFFSTKDSISTVSKRNEEKIHAVRDYIMANLSKNCTLTDLAHQVGTNEFTLKKGFKELFGTTVFNFWNDLKMEEAKKLLISGELNVNEISDRMGYKNPRHFSTAFKRKYNIIPSKIRN